MIIYKCDRCEKEIKNPKYIHIPARPSWSTESINGYYTREKMLCTSCLISFANWLNNNFLYNEYSAMYRQENNNDN